MRRIFVVTLGMCLSALVAGCSSDDDSGDISCNVEGLSLCVVAPASQEKACAENDGVLVDSCPGGALLECQVASGGVTGTAYLYDQATIDALTTAGSGDPCATFQ